MSTASERAQFANLSGRVVLLATEGAGGGVAGAHIALALAATYHATVHVISVVDTRPALMPPPLDLARAVSDASLDPVAASPSVQAIRAALSAATGQAIDWPVRIMLATPASAIVEEAQRIGATLIIVGLHPHGRLSSALNEMTALTVMRHATCPVLGVVPGTTMLPTRVLAAVDFSETSLVATRAAHAVVGHGALFVLAHVAPLTAMLPDDGELVIRELGVQAAFARTVRELGDEGITFDHVVLHHELPRTVADVLLEYAENATSDLIATGSVHRGLLDRWMLGSVSADLVRDGRRSVLIVPPRVTSRR